MKTDSGMMRLLQPVNEDSLFVFDSAEIKNGQFFLEDSAAEPQLFVCRIDNKNECYLFAGNETISFTEQDRFTITGSPLTHDWLAFDSAAVKAAGNPLTSSSFISPQKNKTLFAEADQFIRTHRSSFVSVYLLHQFASFYSAIQLNALYKWLDGSLKKFPAAKAVEQQIDYSLHQSAPCPPFTVTDEKGEQVTLATYKGDYLLIDFWASWCEPCVKQIPLLRDIKNHYKENIRVLQISLDINETAWKEAVKKYKLDEEGKNVWLQESFKNTTAVQFELSHIPYLLLINPQGNIVARETEASRIKQKLEGLFGK